MDTSIEKLQQEGYLCMEILKNRQIRIDDTKFHQELIGVAVGSSEPPRNYVTTWYHETIECLHVCIYLSDLLKDQEEDILTKLAPYLDNCKNEKDLIALNGKVI